MPRVVASGNAAVAAGSAPASAVTVSSEALSASRTIRPRLRPIRERIQLCGDANSGKTYAYLRLARKKLEDARTNGREPEKFFVVDTDDTMPAFLNEGCEFSDLYYENGGNVYPYPAFSWDEAGATIGTICREAKEGDWVIVDVINRLYDQAQRRVAEQKGIVVTDAAFARGLNHSGFGAFGADEWNLVTLIFNATVGRLLQNGNVNVIFVQHTTEVQPHTRERREIFALFDQLGLKPKGAPTIAGAVATVVFLWVIRPVELNERGKRVSAKTVRWFTVLKDRGKMTYASEVYDRDFYDNLQSIRRAGLPTINVTDRTEAEKVLAGAQAAISGRDEDIGNVNTDAGTALSTNADGESED